MQCEPRGKAPATEPHRATLAQHSKRLGAHGTAWIASGMAWCAGYVDAACYTELHRLYTSHMTGNTASFAFHLLHGSAQESARYGWALVCFVIGLLGGAALTHAERRRGIRSAFAAALGIEVVLLLLFVCLIGNPTAPGALLVFLPTAAMGIQTVTVTRVGSLRVYTTYLTGSLSKFAEAVTEYLFWTWDRTRGRFRKRIGKVLRITPRQDSARQAALTAALWIAFFGGAVAGFAGSRSWGPAAVIIPLVPLGAVIAIDLRCPVALGEVTEDELRARRPAHSL